jgi:hypothetical protein
VGKILGLDEVKSTRQGNHHGSDSPQVMNRTLTKLLDNGVDSDPSHEDKTFGKSWQVETTAIFLRGMLVGDKGSILWMPALQFWLQSELSSKLGSKKARRLPCHK